jgi:hypothetical protein
LKKPSSASRWQSALPLISASLAASVGALTGHGVPIAPTGSAAEVLADAFERAEVERLVLDDRPADVPPNCSRWNR